MRSYKRLALLVLALAAIIVWFQVIFFSPPITGRVVDTKGQSIAGAIVVADWPVHASFSNAPIGQLRMFEVVTDAEGRFRIPGWGMEAVVRGTALGPTVRIVHPGYAPLVLDEMYGHGIGFLVPTFAQNGDTFVLEPPSKQATARGNSFPRLYMSLFGPGHDVTVGGNCPKLSMPRMLAAMERSPENFIDYDIPGMPRRVFRARDVENRVPCRFDGGSALQP